MMADDEAIVHLTLNAPWLPSGGTAEVIRRSSPPQPMCVVRLLIRRGERVFCVPRPESGRLDLPMLVVGVDDEHGIATISSLAQDVTGTADGLSFEGAVRNVVGSPQAGYNWPTPHAHFGVWSSANEPTVDGTWVALGAASELRDRHWYPLIA